MFTDGDIGIFFTDFAETATIDGKEIRGVFEECTSDQSGLGNGQVANTTLFNVFLVTSELRNLGITPRERNNIIIHGRQFVIRKVAENYGVTSLLVAKNGAI